MTPEQFCYWLQGRAELQPDNPPSAEEWTSIHEHLQTVFVKVTPPFYSPNAVPNQPVNQDPKHWLATCGIQGGAITQC